MDNNQDMQRILNHPKFPKMDNPTPDQLDQLNGWIKGVVKNLAAIAYIQQDEPDYLPEFKFIN